jgi:hypothetical protein
VGALLALAVAASAGCKTAVVAPTRPTSAAPKPGRTTGAPTSGNPTPAPLVLAPGTTRLTGKVKLIADAKAGLMSDAGGGLVSDAGAGIISDHASGIISDHASGIISNNSGGVIANNGGSLVSDAGGEAGGAARFGLRAAQPPDLAVFALADAEVRLFDAAGKPVLGADGAPLSARTDATGAYALQGALPAGNLVARIALHNGGELAALVVPTGEAALTLDVDTASTLGAAYVLDRLVKGDQKIFDRLPRPEADRLSHELDAVRRFLGAAPSYRPTAMAAAADALRDRVPAVHAVIEDVRALLLGQASLGNGRVGTEVPLAGPTSLFMDRDGALLIGEAFIGRIRRLAADGTLTTLADAGSGTIKTNFLRLEDVARAPDGTLYVASRTTGIYRVTPDGDVSRILTDQEATTGRGVLPQSLAVGPDGTLYLGEFTWGPGQAPRILVVSPDGTKVTTLAIDAAWTGGRVSGLAFGPDGALWVAHEDQDDHGAVYRHRDGAATKVAAMRDGKGLGDLAVAPDGTVYVARSRARRLDAIAPDGTIRAVAGAGTTTGAADLTNPDAVAAGADGTVYVCDEAGARVFALRPDGSWRAVAGSEALTETGETTAFAINQPSGLAFGDDGALYVTESGSSRVRRFHEGRLEIVAGSVAGFAGDGGPALDALLELPSGIARRGGDMWIGEIGKGRIRHIGPEGVISTILGLGRAGGGLQPGPEVPAGDRDIPAAAAIAVDREGRLVFTTGTSSHQLMRFTPGADGGTLRALAGRPRFDGPEVYAPQGYLENDETDPNGVLGFPLGVAIGPGGEPYFAELVPCRVSRLVGLDGPGPVRVERVAGRSLPQMAEAATAAAAAGKTTSEDGVPATENTLVFPSCVAFDAAGNMYIGEAGSIHIGAIGNIGEPQAGENNFGEAAMALFGMPKIAGRIRKVTPDGIITTIAGRGSRFFPADGGDDALTMPMAIAIAPDGRLAIADFGANMIRILPAGSY